MANESNIGKGLGMKLVMMVRKIQEEEFREA
jgi:hypothetical protein